METRNGTARWVGNLADGSGSLTVGDAAWTSSYSYASRFEDGARTDPEEFIAAAHAGCFSMALAVVLSEAGYTPGSISTRARVRLRLVDGLPTIRRIDLETVSDVAGLDEDRFGEFADRAKASCPSHELSVVSSRSPSRRDSVQ